MNKRIAASVAFAIALCLCSVSIAQQDTRYKELPNLHQVNSSLYRGAQPKKGGLQLLKQLGIKTILSLRDDDERSKAEEAEAKTIGLGYFSVPLSSFNRPPDKAVAEVLALINSSEYQPVFVHCERGADRTGTIVAIYRIEHDGWTSEQAKAEAKRYGLGFWQVSMKDYIHDYYERRANSRDDATQQKRARSL
jgi:tyrosine-protein phosphatase SIW14